MTRFSAPMVCLAAVASLLCLGACSSDRVEIPELSRDVLATLDGPVPARDLLNLPGDPIVCLLGPYEEDFLEFGSYSLPEGFSLDALQPLLPIEEGEFVLAILGAKRTLSNRYKRDSELDLLRSVRSARAQPRTVCASISTAIILIQRRAGQTQIALTKDP